MTASRRGGLGEKRGQDASAGGISAKTRTGYLGGRLGRGAWRGYLGGRLGRETQTRIRRRGGLGEKRGRGYVGVGAWERSAERIRRRAGYRLKMRRGYVGGGILSKERGEGWKKRTSRAQKRSGRNDSKEDIRLCRNAKNGEPASRRWVRGGRTSDFPSKTDLA